MRNVALPATPLRAGRDEPQASTHRVDTIQALSECTLPPEPAHQGRVIGHVFDSQRRPLAAVPVRAIWNEDFQVLRGNEFGWKTRRLETDSEESGAFMLCGLPVRRAINISAAKGGYVSRTGVVRVTEAEPHAQLDLTIPVRGAAPIQLPPEADPAASVVPIDSARVQTLFVTDAVGQPIHHAVVTLNGGPTRMSDITGRVFLNVGAQDTLRVFVRRIGYAEFNGRLGRMTKTEPYLLTLLPAPQALTTTNARLRANQTSLELTGFYDRMLQVEQGGVAGEFFTPEQLDGHASTRFSQLLTISRNVQIRRTKNGHAIIGGRAGCAMTIVVDGKRLEGVVTSDQTGANRPVDDLVDVRRIMAVEVYPNVVSAPTLIGSQVLADGCGVIAVWTSGR